MIAKFALLILTFFALFLILPSPGLLKTVVLAILALLSDSFWQIMRCRFIHTRGTGKLMTYIMGGFLFRLLSLLFFIRVGCNYLSPNNVKLFLFCVLLLPIWNVLFMEHSNLGRL